MSRSVWRICPDCDGEGYGPDGISRCTLCMHGVAEYSPLVVDTADARPAIAPVSVPPTLVSMPLPRCLGCGHRTATVHEGCVSQVNAGTWVPCYMCQGLRIDADGFECQHCCGAGFISMTGRDTLAERAGDLAPWQEPTDTQVQAQV